MRWLLLVALLAAAGCDVDYCGEVCREAQACGSEQATEKFCDCEARSDFPTYNDLDECYHECLVDQNVGCQVIHDYANPATFSPTAPPLSEERRAAVLAVEACVGDCL